MSFLPSISTYYSGNTTATTQAPSVTPAAWPGQNYAPPQAYVPQAYNMYMSNQSTLAGYAYGMTPTGSVTSQAE